ncbi:MAG: AAA family ATPase [Pseudonocardia sp.]|nr:AAA family ATPase [Pseudonocardia sp.]
MDEAEHGLHDLLLERLLADDTVDDQVAGLVLAAWEGEDDLAAALEGRPSTATDPRKPPQREPQPDAYLAAVHVEGFRGIGEPATLPLRPGPGLTLVTGRNGSGKSSFAEAAELALTGNSGRWSGRTAVWKEGWRNLHSDGPTAVTVDLVTAGAPGTTRIERRWEPGSELDGGRWTRQRSGEKREDFDGAQWREEMSTYRPFLSYSELGALIDGKPSELHDALHNLLGLGPLGEAQERLRVTRKRLADDARAVGATRRALRTELADVDDDRVVRAAALLKPTAPDLAAVAELVAGIDDRDGEAPALAALASLPVPDAATVAATTGRVRAAADRVHVLAGDEVRSADEVAALLRGALHHHDGRAAITCPVCEQGTLDEAWRAAAGSRAEALEVAATELRQATSELDAAVASAQGLVGPLPAVLEVSPPVDVEAVIGAWSAWVEAGRTPGAAELAHALDRAHAPLVEAADDARKRAQEELTQRDEVWVPIARRLSAWHDDAARVVAHAPRLAALQKAENWLTAAAGELRGERLAPFAEESQKVWQSLRQQSNVDLGPVRLDGTKTRRRVAMDVRIDGTDGGTALGVMSQGELHALGLSLFLPRATVEQSPFRFVLIDDPVQAMDPAKVDGLARVLAEVAATRQVIVFTHDDRLADAVRRLELSATVWEVQRQERSVVEMRRSDDPVRRYLQDAHAMASTKELPADIRSELVASCCRSAVEAACHARIRSVRLTRGDTHAAVEAAIAEATTTHKKATLAVFDDPGRGSDLLGRLRSVGTWAVGALQNCKQGAHHGLTGDLRPFVRDAEQLADWLQT